MVRFSSMLDVHQRVERTTCGVSMLLVVYGSSILLDQANLVVDRHSLCATIPYTGMEDSMAKVKKADELIAFLFLPARLATKEKHYHHHQHGSL